MAETVNKLHSLAKAAADAALWVCGALVVMLVMAIGMAVVAPVIVTDFCVAISCRVLGIPYERNNLSVS